MRDAQIETQHWNILKMPQEFTKLTPMVQVHITPTADAIGFEELPNAFIEFDSDDKKFIAVAVVYENEYHQKVTILQSVDSQWYGAREVFIQNGLTVEFLCEENIRHLYERREQRRP